MGFAVSTHFCGGHPVESVLAIGHKDLDCGMMDMQQELSNPHGGETQLGKVPCCANQYAAYEIEDDYSLEANPVSIDGQFLFVLVYSSLTPGFKLPYVYYDSPPLIADLPVLNQTFLI